MAPRLAERVHDPSTIIECKGQYWCFVTGAGIVSAYSRDLLNWKEGPRVYRQAPAWTTNAVPGNRGHLWAPDMVQLTNRYCLYYSLSTWGKTTSAIGLSTNPILDPDDPAYCWTDRGLVVSTGAEDDHNAIDPSILWDSEGRLWMAFGSYWSGIKLVELNSETGLRLNTNSPLHAVAWSPSIEAAGLYRRAEDYYLFVNWGQCCRGTNSTHEILVGRRKRVTGTYYDRDGNDLMARAGTLFLGTEGPCIGPGHAGFFKRGSEEFVSDHYYDATRAGRPRLQLRRLKWTEDGWPVAGPCSSSWLATGATWQPGNPPSPV